MAAPANGGSMKLEVAPVEAEKIYAFNMEGGGFVIASGDQRTLPVLGSWLKQYDEAIATLGESTDFRDGELTATGYRQ